MIKNADEMKTINKVSLSVPTLKLVARVIKRATLWQCEVTIV